MDRYLSVEALDKVVEGHLTRSVLKSLDTSSLHLEESNLHCPPLVKKGMKGQVARAQEEFLVNSNLTKKEFLRVQNLTEGNNFVDFPTTMIVEKEANSTRGFPPSDNEEITREEGKNHHSIMITSITCGIGFVVP